jgi:glycosyltransferase involved in cell wall biosynthesis
VSRNQDISVAIVHYWFVARRGGEQVVDELCRLYPQADVYTLVHDPEALSETVRGHRLTSSFLQRLPWARRLYQKYLPLAPLALEQFDLGGYDLVISSESGPAKGVLTRPDALHVCYCHTPMRYLWDMAPEYRARAGRLTRWLMVPAAHYLRLWDQASAARVDHFVANSRHVASRIRKYYRRRAHVIHPPVDTDFFTPGPVDREDYYLLLGQLVAYKRPDVAVRAFSGSGRRLLVVGEGEMERTLRREAGPEVEFAGRLSREKVREHLQRCRALVFPGREDFGMVPVEAMACGTPVIALGAGGALETVVEGDTGFFFQTQEPEALLTAVQKFENQGVGLDAHGISRHAAEFGRQAFRSSFEAFVSKVWQ